MRTAQEYSRIYGMLKEMVTETRKKVEKKWPTPDVESSIMYAVTESAEAIDAYLRMKRPGDARNNEKERDIRHELAQCLMMLLTASDGLKEVDVPESCRSAVNRLFTPHKDQLSSTMNIIQLWTSAILPAYWSDEDLSPFDLRTLASQSTIYMLVACDWIGMDIELALIDELSRIESKWTV